MTYDLKLMEELSHNYQLVTKMALIAMRNGFPLVIENPYSTQHFLTKYWALKPKVVDYDRRDRGDFYEKPTQYWFINRDPSENFVFESPTQKETKRVCHARNQVERSMISPDYANRFIREFIL